MDQSNSICLKPNAESSSLECVTLPMPLERWDAEFPADNEPELRQAEFAQLNGHRAQWCTAVGAGLGLSTYLIRVCSANQTTGVLPLCHVSGPLFGSFLVSMPYINTGGVWARDQESAKMLVDSACKLADQLDVKYLELRHEIPVEHERLSVERTDKVHMRMVLPDSAAALLGSFKSKVRSQVKKSKQYSLTAEFGGSELLPDFYDVFSINMRDLGTPVFSKKLFARILDSFEDEAEFCIVRHESKAVAAGLLVHAGGLTEVPSASCLRRFNRMNANMFMYWNMFERGIEQGSRSFDFGRSSEGSGTYRFKSQFGSTPHPATWQYYVRKGNPEEMRPGANGNQRLIRIWQKLPVWLTRLIGPSIVRGIP